MRNEEYISFDSDELLTFDEYDVFLGANPIRKAEIVSDRLLQYLLISNHVLYIYNHTKVTYQKVEQPKQLYLMTIARKFIVESYESLDDKNKRFLRKMYEKEIGEDCSKLFKLEYFQDFILDILYMITNNTIKFDTDKSETHYCNGYVKNKVFQARDPDVHYITEYVDEDYNPKVDSTIMDEDDDAEVEVKIHFSKKEIRRIVDLI